MGRSPEAVSSQGSRNNDTVWIPGVHLVDTRQEHKARLTRITNATYLTLILPQHRQEAYTQKNKRKDIKPRKIGQTMSVVQAKP